MEARKTTAVVVVVFFVLFSVVRCYCYCCWETAANKMIANCHGYPPFASFIVYPWVVQATNPLSPPRTFARIPPPGDVTPLKPSSVPTQQQQQQHTHPQNKPPQFPLSFQRHEMLSCALVSDYAGNKNTCGGGAAAAINTTTTTREAAEAKENMPVLMGGLPSMLTLGAISAQFFPGGKKIAIERRIKQQQQHGDSSSSSSKTQIQIQIYHLEDLTMLKTIYVPPINYAWKCAENTKDGEIVYLVRAKDNGIARILCLHNLTTGEEHDFEDVLVRQSGLPNFYLSHDGRVAVFQEVLAFSSTMPCQWVAIDTFTKKIIRGGACSPSTKMLHLSHDGKRLFAAQSTHDVVVKNNTYTTRTRQCIYQYNIDTVEESHRPVEIQDVTASQWLCDQDQGFVVAYKPTTGRVFLSSLNNTEFSCQLFSFQGNWAVSPQLNVFAIAFRDGGVAFYDTTTTKEGAIRSPMSTFSTCSKRIDFSPTGAHLVVWRNQQVTICRNPHYIRR